jgi:hypothetical protein
MLKGRKPTRGRKTKTNNEEAVEPARFLNQKMLISRSKSELLDLSGHRTRCCSTSSGLQCLAPVCAQEGHFIAILLGEKLPFVIAVHEIRDPNRTTQSEVAQSGGNDNGESSPEASSGEIEVEAEIIGPCIVPEIMFGAALKAVASSGEGQPVKFVLV